MKKLMVKIALLALMTSQVLNAVPNPIDFAATQYIKRLNMSPVNPVDLFRSTKPAAAHIDRHFVSRIIARLELNALNEFDQKRVRNEICASDRLYVTANLPDNADITTIPGSWGVYLHENSIISATGLGLAGERLDTVLRNLSRARPENKEAWAKYLIVAMTRNLQRIHDANMTWNNVELRNFYVAPTGGTYAFDLSEAKITAPLAPASVPSPAKNAEFNNFAKNTLLDMYRTLYPDRNEGFLRHQEFLAEAAIYAAISKINSVSAIPPGNPAQATFAAPGMVADLNAVITALPPEDNARAIQAAAAAANNTKEEVLGAAVKAIVHGAAAKEVLLSIPEFARAYNAIGEVAISTVAYRVAANIPTAQELTELVSNIRGGGAAGTAAAATTVGLRGAAAAEGDPVGNAPLGPARQALVDSIIAAGMARMEEAISNAFAAAPNRLEDRFLGQPLTVAAIKAVAPPASATWGANTADPPNRRDPRDLYLSQLLMPLFSGGIVAAIPASPISKTKIASEVLTQEAIIGALNIILSAPRDARDILTAGLAGNGANLGAFGDYATNVDNFLTGHPQFLPQPGQIYVPVLAGHVEAGAANHVFVDTVLPLVPLPLTGVAATKAALCGGWTGL